MKSVDSMKILKLYLIWGGILFVTQVALLLLGDYLFGVLGVLIAGALGLPVAGLCGYMVGKAMKSSSASTLLVVVWGAGPSVVAGLLVMIFDLVLTGKFNFTLPLLPGLFGMAGAYIGYNSGRAPVRR